MEPIKADYVGMINKSDELWKLTLKLMEEITRLISVMDNIDIFWDGEANTEFKLALNEDFAVMEALCLHIRLSAKLIKDAVLAYVDVERLIESMIGGI